MCIFFMMNLNIVQCLYVNNVLYVYNCIHEKAIKPYCILNLDFWRHWLSGCTLDVCCDDAYDTLQ